jgi:two-component system LytT family response regulator
MRQKLPVVDECADLPNGVKAIRKHKPDLIFLDIEMPGHSG